MPRVKQTGRNMLFVIAVVSVYLALVISPTDSTADSSYVAAVYEHKVILNLDPRVPVSRHDALQHMQKNLDIYEEQAARAAQQVCTYLKQYYSLTFTEFCWHVLQINE